MRGMCFSSHPGDDVSVRAILCDLPVMGSDVEESSKTRENPAQSHKALSHADLVFSHASQDVSTQV